MVSVSFFFKTSLIKSTLWNSGNKAFFFSFLTNKRQGKQGSLEDSAGSCLVSVDVYLSYYCRIRRKIEAGEQAGEKNIYLNFKQSPV